MEKLANKKKSKKKNNDNDKGADDEQVEKNKDRGAASGSATPVRERSKGKFDKKDIEIEAKTFENKEIDYGFGPNWTVVPIGDKYKAGRKLSIKKIKNNPKAP